LITLEFIPRPFKYPHCFFPSTLPKYNMLLLTVVLERWWPELSSSDKSRN